MRILDMIDPGIIHLVDGPKIDSPMNAITLTRTSIAYSANSKYILNQQERPTNIGSIQWSEAISYVIHCLQSLGHLHLVLTGLLTQHRLGFSVSTVLLLIL